jgi:serine/threonine protein kinase
MTNYSKRPLPVGSRLGPNLTVLGALDPDSVEPVYIVWHHRSWCPMACKIFKKAARAQREANMISKFAHPNIVRCFGIEQDRFLLMPFLEGRSLASAIDKAPRQRFKVSDALRVAIHIGAALQHVHEQGVIHLDVKPANVIITPNGLPVLFDFGSARRLGSARPPEVIGTDGYISPEECSLGEATAASDVFSLGVILYEMLTGTLPFEDGTPDHPFPQFTGDPAPLRRYREALPKGLEDLVLSCLNRSPNSRPTLAALLPLLNAHIDRGPRMWPAGFEPDVPAVPAARRATGRAKKSLAANDTQAPLAPCQSPCS